MSFRGRIRIKRVYEDADPADGFRILVDRLWPRGVSKAGGKVDLWLRDVAPSTELRKWYGHDPGRWKEFRKRYFGELDEQAEALETIRGKLEEGPVTFVFSSREMKLNNAAALKEYLEKGPTARRR